jgi:organic hydroperoxide reductase OsmC/OhrA
MDAFPHHYVATALGAAHGDVEINSAPLPPLVSASPAEFGGPGDKWSPETLLVAAVADCFVLTFRAVARASHLAWTSLECQATGTLDRIERVTMFTRVDLHVRLTVPYPVSADVARRALEKAERNCLISSSLKAAMHLDATVEVVEPVEEPISAG